MASAGAAGSTQTVVAAARIARVVGATSKLWSPQAAVRAMTRGWNGSTGVHLFGKVASRAGGLVQVGVGVYRIYTAKTNTEVAQAAVGTGAGIAGGYAGASWGATVGTAILPGIGTVIGGILGGLFGSVGSQVAAEKCVALVSDAIDPVTDLCLPCRE